MGAALQAAALQAAALQCLLLASGCQAFADELPDGDVVLLLHQVQLEPLSDAGRSCFTFNEDFGSTSSSTGSPGTDQWSHAFHDLRGLTLRAGSGEEEIEKRFYSQAFAAAEGVDRFIVRSPNTAMQFTVWGAFSCDAPEPAEL